MSTVLDYEPRTSWIVTQKDYRKLYPFVFSQKKRKKNRKTFQPKTKASCLFNSEWSEVEAFDKSVDGGY